MEFSKEIETLEGTHTEIKLEMKNPIVQVEKESNTSNQEKTEYQDVRTK